MKQPKEFEIPEIPFPNPMEIEEKLMETHELNAEPALADEVPRVIEPKPRYGVPEKIRRGMADVATNVWKTRNKMVDGPSGEVREEMKRVYRHIQSVFEAFDIMGLEVKDHTGDDFDYGMPLKVVTSESKEGISHECVLETIKPTVYWEGKIIQMGEVVIATPLSQNPKMNRTTIDFGIDLGTTNSAIAVLKGVGTEVIKNNADADITPSAVSIDKKGTLLVGQRAKNRIYDNPDDAYIEFKRRMGSDHVYHFKSNGQSRKPEELSAEILRSLRADVQQRMDDVLEACVVTVPAAFELHQCDATRKAAQLAGFKESPLLQEPVAAALSYGFQVDEEKAYWLVYDFGGGTFDAAIIKAEEGTIHVVNHGGDNFLGGSDIDWALVEQVLVPRLLGEFDLKQFNRGNPQWRQAFAKLKRAAEIAKIDLSRSERTMLETCKFSDASGTEIEFECEVRRRELLKVAEPIIAKSTEICKRILKEKSLGAAAVEKVILVGGPTLAPYFREALAGSIGIPLDHSVDPLTVVARGAAVFAGTQRLAAPRSSPVAAGEYSIDLKYKTVSNDPAPLIGGKVAAASPQDFSGFTLELANTKTLWRSGRIPLGADGVFLINLHAERGERNTYAIELLDPSGTRQKTTPNTLHYTVGAAVEEQPLINSMGIALANNNEYDRLCEKGHGLPLKSKRVYRTINPIRKGQNADSLTIPVIEGELERADRNRLVGKLEVEGVQVVRDLPANSEVEVTLLIDESRIITVTAYVPLLDQEFITKLDMKLYAPNPETLNQEYTAEIKRFNDLKAKAAIAGGDSADGMLQNLEDASLIRELREMVPASKGDPDVAARFEKRLLQLKQSLDEAEDALEWPALVAEVRVLLGQMEGAVKENGSPAFRQRAAELISATDEVIADHKMDRLRRKREHITQLLVDVWSANPAWWVNQFRIVENMSDRITDPAKGNRLFELGRNFLAKNDAEGLANIVRQIVSLLPRDCIWPPQIGAVGGHKSNVVR